MKIFAGLALGTLVLFGVLFAWTHHGPADEPAVDRTPVAHEYTCGPCGMGMPASSKRLHVGDYTFVACGTRCKQLIAAQPGSFAEFALPESRE